MNYNCNENNEQYYIDFENELRKIFNVNDYEDVEYIPKVLEKMGYKIIIDYCRRVDYSGGLNLLYEKEGKFYIFESSYGSCSTCDIWYETSESVENFMSVFKDEDRSTVEFDNEEGLLEFVENHYFFNDGFKDKIYDLYY